MSVSMIPPEGGGGEATSPAEEAVFAAGRSDECGAVEEHSAMGADGSPSDRIGVIVSPPSKPKYNQRFEGPMVPGRAPRNISGLLLARYLLICRGVIQLSWGKTECFLLRSPAPRSS
jgi:hypothetical protein